MHSFITHFHMVILAFRGSHRCLSLFPLFSLPARLCSPANMHDESHGRRSRLRPGGVMPTVGGAHGRRSPWPKELCPRRSHVCARVASMAELVAGGARDRQSHVHGGVAPTPESRPRGSPWPAEARPRQVAFALESRPRRRRVHDGAHGRRRLHPAESHLRPVESRPRPAGLASHGGRARPVE